MQPATNRRNAAVLRRDMELALGVGAERGVVRFVGLGEGEGGGAWGDRMSVMVCTVLPLFKS